MKLVTLATFRRYALPAALTAGLFAACAVLVSRGPVPHARAVPLEYFVYSQGRCLVVVVERDGAYIGPDRVAIDALSSFVSVVYRGQHLDGAIVYGADGSRYGDFVRVYSDLRKIFGDRTSVCALPIAPGTRWRPIEFMGHWWNFRKST